MPTRSRKHRTWNSLLNRYSGDLVTLTERRHNEALLALAAQHSAAAAEAQTATAAAVNANHAKDEFLAHISHELRTPLNAIIGFSEMIEGQLATLPQADKVLDYVHDIKSSGWHLNRVVNDLLDYAKFEAGKLQLFVETVDFAVALQACYIMVRGRLETKQIDFLRAIAEGLPPLRVDEMKLKQILINLLSNAGKFTPDGGSIAVEAGVTDEGCFLLRVRDSGIGIPEEEIANVFLPFYQRDSKLTRKYEGTGLGLPLTKALVELHGGTIRLDSAPGRGTVATVELPAECLVTAGETANVAEDLADPIPTGRAA